MTRNDTLIRAVLRSKEHEEGRTLPEIAAVMGVAESQINRAARRMPDLYIDRWEARTNSAGAQYHVAVYCVVVPPPDAQRPERKVRPRTDTQRATEAASKRSWYAANAERLNAARRERRQKQRKKTDGRNQEAP